MTKEVWRPQPPLLLATLKDHFFNSSCWTMIAMGPTKGELVFQELDCKYLVIGDTKSTPPEIQISLATLSADLEGLCLLACCIHPPFYLPKGQTIAQAIPIPPTITVDDHVPEIYWAEVVGQNKPIISCYSEAQKL